VNTDAAVRALDDDKNARAHAAYSFKRRRAWAGYAETLRKRALATLAITTLACVAAEAKVTRITITSSESLPIAANRSAPSGVRK